jgi:hypothetical protein
MTAPTIRSYLLNGALIEDSTFRDVLGNDYTVHSRAIEGKRTIIITTDQRRLNLEACWKDQRVA